MSTFLQQLFEVRGQASPGYNSLQLSQSLGLAKEVLVTAFEPDPLTFRDYYYYNSTSNTLYKKLVSKDKSFWRRISQ